MRERFRGLVLEIGIENQRKTIVFHVGERFV